MNEVLRLRLVEPVTAQAASDPQAIWEHALDLMLTHRGTPSDEVERALAADPVAYPLTACVWR